MRYYEVYPAAAGYQKWEPLTYHYDGDLPIGSVVSIPYGKSVVSGFVVSKSKKPDFETKPLELSVKGYVLPGELLELHHWISAYYPSGSGAVAQMLVPSGIKDKVIEPGSLEIKKPKTSLPQLSDQQSQALNTIDKSPKKTFVLHGETGSGKTRIYIERAKRMMSAGKSSIILTPEISLVPQLERSFGDVFGDKVIVIHSGLTKSKRNKNWLKILKTEEPMIIIGTRSAIFAPIDNIGLIVVDEMHEPAYKQDSAPHYNALRVAAQRAKLNSSEIIYGSATPSIMEYYLATQTNSPILRLDKRLNKDEEVEKTLIDLKDRSLFSKHPYLSDSLIGAIGQNISTGNQVLIFLNRRGTARQILCKVCGWQSVCPKCDLPLTLHADNHKIRCHTCGFTDKPPYSCPECGNNDIIFRGLGTKALTEALATLFPEVKIARFDTDNPVADTLHRNYDSVSSGDIDMLVGTQMLGKGLDLPKLGLVAIVNADSMLSMPDFSSAERGYQLLHQAIGRVGRGHKAGQVIVQTYRPNDPIISAALSQDWQAMYRQELKEREAFGFPPFYFLLKITVSRKSSKTAAAYAQKLHDFIRSQPFRAEVEEPAPAFYERSFGKYNWQIVIKAKQRSQLQDVIKSLPKGDFTYDIDPLNLL